MLLHLSQLDELDNSIILETVLDNLCNKTIPNEYFIFKNLLLLFNQPSLLNGDFSNFNFSRLNLRNCKLTELTLSKGGRDTDLNRARIGYNTFLKDSHHAPVICIDASKGGCNVLTCGKDKVFLWHFNDHTVEKEIYRYPIKIGAFDDTQNQCCFSEIDEAILLTNSNKLLSCNLKRNKNLEYMGAECPIISITTLVAENKNEYFLVRDIFASVSC